MKPKLLTSSKIFNPGDGSLIKGEERIENIEFDIHKFSDRQRPTEKHENIYFSCFSEFGCEIIGTSYCIPRLVNKFPDYYFTAIGWRGREFLYRHLVDEYWEMKEEHQWLREYCRAFHHESKNLNRVQDKIREKGVLVTHKYMGRLFLGTQCEYCNMIWTPSEQVDRCQFCDSTEIRQPLFRDINKHRQGIVLPRSPSQEKMDEVKEKYLGINPVGVFARGRKCYGRNLQPEFYVKLISLLREYGYDPIWLGEKQSTQPCPVDDVMDFSRMPESRDLETTLAIVKQCAFTVQFWTASTRLAALVNTPYLLFESPDQLWGKGQEGLRLDLVTSGKRKISANDFLNVFNDNDGGLAIVEECIHEMQQGNYADHIGMVADRRTVHHMMSEYKAKH